MRILSIRKGFQADHSSTSYEFFAVEKSLNRSEREAVADLSSRANPTKRRVSFIYHGDWSDLPGGWEPLMKSYYDVMYSESYDWWTLAMGFEMGQKGIKELSAYEFSGSDEMGVTIQSKGNRAIVSIACRLDPGFDLNDGYSDNDYYDSYEDDDEEEEESDEIVELGDYLLDLLVNNREYLKNGDYRLLYGIRRKYSFEPEDDEEFDDDIPPEPPGMDELPEPISSLLSLLEE